MKSIIYAGCIGVAADATQVQSFISNLPDNASATALSGLFISGGIQMSDQKFYWLKLKNDFFKRHDIRIVEDMPNGKDYILFYLKMLVESVSHDGELRFSDTIPYNEQMLCTITNTNIDIVRAAMKIFTELGMIEILDNQTIYMTEVHKMIGCAADNDNANRQRRFRAKKKAESIPSVTKCNAPVTEDVTKDNESIELELELELEKELELDNSIVDKPQKKSTRFTPPSVDEVEAYCDERNNLVDAQKFVDYYSARGWKIGKSNQPMKDWKAAVRLWERNNYSGSSGNASVSSRNPFRELQEREGMI